MKVSEHLAAMHKAAHDHHTEMIAAHETALKKAEGMEDADHQEKFHGAAITSHQQMADYHKGAMEECAKVAAANGASQYVPRVANRGGYGSVDLVFGDLDGPRTSKAMDMDRIVPDRVSGILTPIPRAGQREIEKAEVPLEFEKMFSLEDGQ